MNYENIWQVKISSLSEQLLSTDKQNENHADTQRKLMDKLSEQNDELDSLKAELNLLNQEKESLVKALDSSRAEKFAVEKNRAEISDMVNTSNAVFVLFNTWYIENHRHTVMGSIRTVSTQILQHPYYFTARIGEQRL